MSQRHTQPSLKRDAAAWDIAADLGILALVVFLPALLYLPALGFYSDDWWFLQALEERAATPLIERFVALLPITELRPAHALLVTLTHAVFGLAPLGHHLVNHAFMLLILVAQVSALRQLGVSHSLALLSAVIFGLMPAYGTLRFWLAAQMVNLSLLLYLLSLGIDLRVARADTRTWIVGRALSVTLAAGSVLLYELCMPALLLNPFLAWWQRRGPSAGPRPDRRLILDIIVNWSIVLAAAAFKRAVSPRAVLDPDVTFLSRLVRLVRGVVNHHAITNGLAEPLSVWTILTRYQDLWTLLLAVLMGVTVGVYVFWRTARSPLLPATLSRRQGQLAALRVILIGLTTLLLGYLIFTANDQFYFSAAGTANRITQVGSLGVAIALAGALALLVTLPGPPGRLRAVLCAIVGVYGAAGVLITVTVGSFWAEAYRREVTILADLQRVAPTLPSGATVLLDGVCPYHGPAIVFESDWDLEGAVRIAYRDWTLRAGVMSPRLTYDDRAVSIWLTRPESAVLYHYGEHLLLYHPGQPALLPIRSADDLRQYLAAQNPENACPFGWPGNGVTILPRS